MCESGGFAFSVFCFSRACHHKFQCTCCAYDQPVFNEGQMPRFFVTARTDWQQVSTVSLRHESCVWPKMTLTSSFPLWPSSTARPCQIAWGGHGHPTAKPGVSLHTYSVASLDLCVFSSKTVSSLVLRFLFHDQWLWACLLHILRCFGSSFGFGLPCRFVLMCKLNTEVEDFSLYRLNSVL